MQIDDLLSKQFRTGHQHDLRVLDGCHDQGRAMLQTVHDLAPGASLKYATARNGLFQFADNIRALRAAGSDIIADGVYYLNEPFFQEGPVNVAISDVVASGALYFTAAGDYNYIIGGKDVASYEAPAHRPATCPAGLPQYVYFGHDDCHDFDPGGSISASSAFTLTNNGYVTVDFQYSEPWYDVSDDFDIYLVDDLDNLVGWSVDVNISTQQPSEFFYFKNTSGFTQRYRIIINRFTGSGTPRLKYVLMGAYGLQSVQYDTSSGGDIIGPTLVGHGATRFGFSVAAVPFNNLNDLNLYFAWTRHALLWSWWMQAQQQRSPQRRFNRFCRDRWRLHVFLLLLCFSFTCVLSLLWHGSRCIAWQQLPPLKQKANSLSMPLTRAWTKFILQDTAVSVSGGDVNSVGGTDQRAFGDAETG
jgi:hypothetical protein